MDLHRLKRTTVVRWGLGRTSGLFLLLLMLVAATAAGARGGQPQPLVFGIGDSGEIQQPVEQWTDFVNGVGFVDQSQWVVNPTGCAWDVDDHWGSTSPNASLAATTSASLHACEVGDVNPVYNCVSNLPGANGPYTYCGWWSVGTPAFFRGLQVFIAAPTSVLTVQTCYQPQGRCFAPQPVYNLDQRRYEWSSCTGIRFSPDDPALAVIPGSNGETFTPTRGLGVMEQLTVTVTNPTGKVVKPIFASVRMVGAAEPGLVCNPTAGGYNTFDYPFSWKLS